MDQWLNNRPGGVKRKRLRRWKKKLKMLGVRGSGPAAHPRGEAHPRGKAAVRGTDLKVEPRPKPRLRAPAFRPGGRSSQFEATEEASEIGLYFISEYKHFFIDIGSQSKMVSIVHVKKEHKYSTSRNLFWENSHQQAQVFMYKDVHYSIIYSSKKWFTY